MEIKDELVDAIIGTIGQIVDPIVVDNLALSDLYEAFLFSLAVEAAEAEDAAVHYEQIGQGPALEFVFRTSPGHIYSTTQPYTFAVLDFPDAPPLEIHLGLRVAGKSLVLHECDISILGQAEANRCRQDMTAPKSSAVVAAIEAKFYAANLKLDLARSYIGLIADLSAKNAYFVSNISSPSVSRLLSAHKYREWQDCVIPESAGAGRLTSFLETSLHRYRASA